MKIGIIFAMQEEINEFLKNINETKENKIYDLTFIETKFNNINLILVESGIGKVNAARSTQILIDTYKPNYIFNVGVAGGISENINVLDIVIGEKLIQHDFDITAFNHKKGYIPNIGTSINSDKKLINIAKTIKNPIIGTIASGDIFCTDPNMTKKINKKFSALCVEMEGAAIAQVCKLSNTPFLIIRSISDTPNNNNQITYEKFLKQSCQTIAYYMNEILKHME